MGKNVAVFVDVANIFYAAKAAGVDIDYVTLLKAAISGRDFVRAYAYTGLDPENENQRNFHSFLARHGYKVVSKDIRKYGDGKVKANLDIELVVDMMKTARNLDVAIVVSGDGDFAPAIRAVQEMGVRVEVISFRGNTSSDLMEVADLFTDISQIARVDRDSQRSGRRVAGDEEDLSMTEVPDKQTEGAPRRRRGRGRGERPERAEVVAVSQAPSNGRGAPVAAGQGRMVVLPGERLSRAATRPGQPAEVSEELVEQLADMGEIEVFTEQDAGVEAGADQQGEGRRRRRRGGRGRGRGRGQGEEQVAAAPDAIVDEEEAEAVDFEPQPRTATTPATPTLAAPPVTRPNPFGSVWDSQIGMATTPSDLAPLPAEEEDFAEPEIPEYLLAERKRGRGGRGGGGGGGRGGARSAYVTAMERERFGRSTRYPEPVRQPQPQRRRDERPQRQPQPQPQRQQQAPRQPQPARTSNEPWSEVPDELEELLRAQLAAKSRAGAEARPQQEAAEAPEAQREDQSKAEATAPATGATRRGRGRAAAGQVAGKPSAEAAAPEAAAEPVAARGRGRRRAAETATSAAMEPATGTAERPQTGVQTPAEEAAAPVRRRRTARTAEPVAEAAAEAGLATASGTVEAEASSRRRAPSRRKAADTAEPQAAPAEVTAETAAPKRRAPSRRKAAEPGADAGQE